MLLPTHQIPSAFVARYLVISEAVTPRPKSISLRTPLLEIVAKEVVQLGERHDAIESFETALRVPRTGAAFAREGGSAAGAPAGRPRRRGAARGAPRIGTEAGGG